MRNKIVVSGIVALMAASCGHSEDEWQAQLAKYNQLNDSYQKEKAANARASADLSAVEAQVAELTAKLREMGVNVETLSTEKERLNGNLQQMQQALDEYKQRAAQLERIKQRFEQLRDKLQKLTNLGLKVQIRHNRMVISLPGDVLFASGSDKLKPEGVQVLHSVADVIRGDAQLSKRYFQVAGHTDSKPLMGGKFNDNWGLSAMRARQVLVYLVAPTDAKDGGGGLNPTQLHAAGYGETDPVASNDTDDGRQTNRRVELVLMPDVEEMLDLKSLL
ncbi:MAG TPA: OmpA family protein [Polyangiaceae bacterium]|nr:OmpA family protein [Polyangiaceae bacterium]